ncbi:hypothetical protein P4S63_03665 [Pseudoalteromonas sp. B193]
MLVQAATRGDGFTGENITQNVKTILMYRLSYVVITQKSLKCAAVFMDSAGFDKLNTEAQKRGEKVFVNPRNAAAKFASTRLEITAKRPLMFYAYSTGLVADGGIPEDHYQQLEKLTDSGLPLCPETKLVEAS